MVPRSQEAEIPKLTKRLIDSLNPRATDYVVWDADVKGFGARVRPSGRITYILKYRVRGGRGGVVRKPAIGRHGAVTVDQARAIARQWLAEVARGGDPSAQRGEARAGPTVAALAERYLREHAEPYKKPSSVAEDRRLIEKRINPAFGMKKAQAVSRADVARLHGGLRSKAVRREQNARPGVEDDGPCRKLGPPARRLQSVPSHKEVRRGKARAVPLRRRARPSWRCPGDGRARRHGEQGGHRCDPTTGCHGLPPRRDTDSRVGARRFRERVPETAAEQDRAQDRVPGAGGRSKSFRASSAKTIIRS